MNLFPLWLALGAMAVFTLGVLVGAGTVGPCKREHVKLAELVGVGQ
jgi:hypothetical protein